MLSLSPRYDLFKFSLPKDFLPQQIIEKYSPILNSQPGVLSTPIDYLNESIQGISFPGISDILISQVQHGSNGIQRMRDRINTEPRHEIYYTTTSNPLDKIGNDFKVTFRQNQGLYNYFMLYETTLYQLSKEYNREPISLYIELLGEGGKVISYIMLKDVLIDGIDGLEFNFSKIEREAGTFDLNFKFNNIDFKFLENI